MSNEKLLYAIGKIDDRLVKEAAPTKSNKVAKNTIIKLVAVVACFALALSIIPLLNIIQQEQSVPADLPPMIFVGSTLYKQSTSQNSYNELIDEFIYIGEIESLTDPLQKPNEDLQANHDIVGSRVYQYEENIVVLINGKYWLYEVFSE